MSARRCIEQLFYSIAPDVYIYDALKLASIMQIAVVLYASEKPQQEITNGNETETIKTKKTLFFFFYLKIDGSFKLIQARNPSLVGFLIMHTTSAREFILLAYTFMGSWSFGARAHFLVHYTSKEHRKVILPRIRNTRR